MAAQARQGSGAVLGARTGGQTHHVAPACLLKLLADVQVGDRRQDVGAAEAVHMRDAEDATQPQACAYKEIASDARRARPPVCKVASEWLGQGRVGGAVQTRTSGMQYVRDKPSRILFGLVYSAIFAMLMVTLLRWLCVGVRFVLPCVPLPFATQLRLFNSRLTMLQRSKQCHVRLSQYIAGMTSQ